MTMVKLAGRWFPGIDHPHFKIQSLACEWMVCIDVDSVPLDFCDRDKLLTCAAVNAEPHSDLHVVDGAELRLRDFDSLFLIPFAVRIFRRHRNFQSLAGGLSFQRRLESGDDVPRAVNVGKGFLTFGTLDQNAGFVRQSMLDSNDFALLNCHRGLL